MLITAYGPAGRPASHTVSSFPSKNGAGSHRINGPICLFLHLFIHVQELDLYPLCSLGSFELLGSVGSLGPRQPGIRHKNKKTVEMFDESKQRERERHKIIITARQIWFYPPTLFSFVSYLETHHFARQNGNKFLVNFISDLSRGDATSQTTKMCCRLLSLFPRTVDRQNTQTGKLRQSASQLRQQHHPEWICLRRWMKGNKVFPFLAHFLPSDEIWAALSLSSTPVFDNSQEK